MKRALLVAMLVCVLGAGAAGVEHLLALRAATAPATPEAFVQAAWSVYRLAPGHKIHVKQQGLSCKQCHTTSDGQHFDTPSPSVCADCHEEQTSIHHVQTSLDEEGNRVDAGTSAVTMTDCLTCHGFGPDPDHKPSDCLDCHARPKHDIPAVTIHADQQCTSCHDVHENHVAPLDCNECHDIQTTHGDHPPASAAQCLDCHHAHAPAQFADSRCGDCHQSKDSKVPVPATASAGQHTCLGCHRPHQFAKAQVERCTSCHSDQHALAGSGHRECTNCHAPHDAKNSVSAHNVCTKCHEDVGLKHNMPVEDSKACTGCHAAHPPRTQEGPAACTSCHQDVAKADLTAHAPGMACTGCHAPHKFTRPHDEGMAVCSECHKPRIKQLANTGHARCEGCHEAIPHGGLGGETACGSCHEQGSTVHEGHRTCTQCHDAHTGARQAKLCVSCHQSQSSTLSKKHGECQNCHEPHAATPAPQIAACTGCHQTQKLPALHQVSEHQQNCHSCHEAHPEKPPSAAATCRSCHQDKADHQPEATQCSGCHPFEAPPKSRSKT